MRPLREVETTLRVGHVYVDVSRRSLRFLNKTAEQLHKEGVPFLAEEFAKGTLQILDGEPATAADLPLYVTCREGRPASAQFILTRPGGGIWHVAWNTSPLWSPTRRLKGVLGTVTCGPPQPNSDRLAELAHDLRTPLQALRLQCALVEQLAADSAPLKESLTVLRRAAERSVQIAMELLDSCRGPTLRSRPTTTTWFALTPFLQTLAEEQAVAAQAKGLGLTTDLTATRQWEIQSEPIRLGRLLSNLLVNAVRYTERGSVTLRTAWREEQGERLLEIRVSDTGVGITEAEQESIFQPYERGKAGKEGDSGGSGLGLAVVDRLVEELGLRIEVDSIWGRGSSFTVLVPPALLRAAAP
ncbi:MAG TPA: HAMP domain-containing sensor histidine kinase [Gemmataceae bacterium]|nr:HAMP domain-containing sensor histidine kinase [Gemmataceae bacterium]